MRLIDADEVQKILDHIRGKYVDTYNRRTKVNQFFWDTIRYIEKKVRSIPTVEAKEVVHCKNCKYFCSNYPNVLNADGLCENTDTLTDKEDFCSHGASMTE